MKIKDLVTPKLIKQVLQSREGLDQYGIVIGREKDTDRVLGFKFAYKTNCHYDMERIFGKEIFNNDFIYSEILVNKQRS